MSTPTKLDALVLNAISKTLSLPAERLGMHDDFVHLGGNSLKAAQVVTLIQAAFPKASLAPQDLLRLRTPARLLDFLHRQGI